MNDSPENFTLISPNPFIVGNPVRDRAMFFGREAEFELVRKRFTETEAKGGLLVFCGERRSGKTSILFQILDGRLGPDFLPVLIDMQSMAIENEMDFLGKIAEEIATRLEKSGEPVPSGEMVAGSNPAAAFHKFVGKVLRSNPDRKLILLFDEYELFENKIESGVLTEDTLFILSNLLENHSVFLIFTGSLSLEERKQDYWKIFLGKSIFRQISYLEYADADRLITEPVKGRATYEDGVVDRIYRLTAGQPFYTQAVCQNLVDLVNENRSNIVRKEMVEEVMGGIIQNPFPQMIFMWEGMEDREKLVMALLAETLEDGDDSSTSRDLLERIRIAKYPLDLDNAAIATSLEKLFRHEILLKNTKADSGYAFRMDLWRLWVRRMHSVWQAMREIGMEIRTSRKPAMPMWIGAGGAVILLALIAFMAIQLRGPSEPSTTTSADPKTAAFLSLSTAPENAVIYRNNSSVGVGSYEEATPSGDHDMRIAATGYADSSFVLSLSPEDTTRLQITLRPLMGQAVFRTNPSGARITVVKSGDSMNRDPDGTSPLELSLPAPPEYAVMAELAGHETRVETFSVYPDSTVVHTLTLKAVTTSLAVTTTPPGATVYLDGDPVGQSPIPGLGISPGSYRFSIQLAGYVTVDTSLTVNESGGQLHLPLRVEPPGFIQLRGDAIAVMAIDNREVMRNTYNSGEVEVRPGTHAIKVRLQSGEVVEDSIEVKSGERVVYNYTEKRIASRTP